MSETLTVDVFEGAEVEIRSEEERIIEGKIVPYGETIVVRGRPETFQRGALSGVQPRAKLLNHHDKRIAIGVMTHLEEREDGAYARFKISKTAAGDEALTLARDGVLDGFSIGFVAQRDSSGMISRVDALPEVSLVTFPAYESARVLAVREQESHRMGEESTADADAEERDAAEDVAGHDGWEKRLGDLSDGWEKRQSELSAQVTKLTTMLDAPDPDVKKRARKITPARWFAAEVHANFRSDTSMREQLDEEFAELIERAADFEDLFTWDTRDLADITGTFPEASPPDDVSGLVVEQFIGSQLVNVLDPRRPFFANCGAFPMPRSGYARIPIVTQNVLVDKRTGQKDPANTRAMIITTKAFEAEWLDGAVDVALEIIRTAELPILSLLWMDFLVAYARATELSVVGNVEAGAHGFTYTGSALPVNTYEAFAKAVATQAIEVFEGSGSPATKLAVTKAQWPELVAMVDANDRRILSTRGPQNADSSATLTATSFELPGGIHVFYTPGLTQAVLYNEQSIRVSDGGPERVEATNVELMGRDIGILGRTIEVPRIPDGVVVFGDDPGSS